MIQILKFKKPRVGALFNSAESKKSPPSRAANAPAATLPRRRARSRPRPANRSRRASLCHFLKTKKTLKGCARLGVLLRTRFGRDIRERARLIDIEHIMCRVPSIQYAQLENLSRWGTLTRFLHFAKTVARRPLRRQSRGARARPVATAKVFACFLLQYSEPRYISSFPIRTIES